MKRPLILVTNDDGIHSPGLRAAVESVLHLGDVLIIAPTHQQTSMGRSFPPTDGVIHTTTLEIGEQRIEAFHVDGSPAQAVLYGILLLNNGLKPDLVISGINYGENIGSGITISGTVGAAMQAASLGIPSLAVSLETAPEFHHVHGDVDWSAAQHFTREFARKLLEKPMPFDVDVLKVDVPCTATAETPWKVTRQSRHAYYESYLEVEGNDILRAQLRYRRAINVEALEKDSDIYVFWVERFVSVTPLSLDCTSRVSLQELEALLRKPNDSSLRL